MFILVAVNNIFFFKFRQILKKNMFFFSKIKHFLRHLVFSFKLNCVKIETAPLFKSEIHVLIADSEGVMFF